MAQKVINSADLKGWGMLVGESLDKVTVIHDFHCGICSSSLQGPSKEVSFTDLHSLITEVLWHMRTDHPGTIPNRPEPK